MLFFDDEKGFEAGTMHYASLQYGVTACPITERNNQLNQLLLPSCYWRYGHATEYTIDCDFSYF